MAYRYGDRKQETLFPQSVDDFISEDAVVRAYDVIINSLDFRELGIARKKIKRCVINKEY